MSRFYMVPTALILASLLVSIGCEREAFTSDGTQNSLADVVRKYQRQNVRESYGELAHECFTWDDLSLFTRTKKATRIAEGLKRSRAFLQVVVALRNMPSEDRDKLFKACRRPLRPTWAQLGRITPEGQTDAGVQAEQLIADAIVDLAQRLVDLPEGEIQKLLDSAGS
jgi:hypothetical protein